MVCELLSFANVSLCKYTNPRDCVAGANRYENAVWIARVVQVASDVAEKPRVDASVDDAVFTMLPESEYVVVLVFGSEPVLGFLITDQLACVLAYERARFEARLSYNPFTFVPYVDYFQSLARAFLYEEVVAAGSAFASVPTAFEYDEVPEHFLLDEPAVFVVGLELVDTDAKTARVACADRRARA